MPDRLTGLLFLLVFSIGCGSSTGERSGDAEKGDATDRRTEIRLHQYKVQGKQLYQTYCQNCHNAEGTGLAKLYPPLAGADYLLEDLPRAACLIKNGKTEEIVVNGVTYNQMMPGNPNLTPLEIAEILTYITNSWDNEKGISSTREVTKWLQDCE